MELHLRAVGYHLPYGITQWYCHATHSVLTPVRQASTWFSCRRGMDGWVTGYIPR